MTKLNRMLAKKLRSKKRKPRHRRKSTNLFAGESRPLYRVRLQPQHGRHKVRRRPRIVKCRRGRR